MHLTPLQGPGVCVQDVDLLGQEWALKQRWEGAVHEAGTGSFMEADLEALKAMAASLAASLCPNPCAADWPLHLHLQVCSEAVEEGRLSETALACPWARNDILPLHGAGQSLYTAECALHAHPQVPTSIVCILDGGNSQSSCMLHLCPKPAKHEWLKPCVGGCGRCCWKLGKPGLQSSVWYVHAGVHGRLPGHAAPAGHPAVTCNAGAGLASAWRLAEHGMHAKP